MPEDLTPAERAVYGIIHRRVDPPHYGDGLCLGCAETARAVVAAVRPIIAAQTDRWDGYCCHDHVAEVVMKAADEIETGAVTAALRSTEKGTTDDH